MYSGTSEPSDENAAKAAGHELRAANQYFSVQRDVARNVLLLHQQGDGALMGSDKDNSDGYVQTKDHLCLPLQALVDFRGFRLVAMPVLPLQGGR